MIVITCLWNEIYQYELKYEKLDLNQFNKKKRSRPRHNRIYWFNPPYDERVRTNVIQRMFAALERCYPRGHRLNKIFNRHTIKASYRTLANMSKQIAIHNSIVMKEYNNNHITQQPPEAILLRIAVTTYVTFEQLIFLMN